MKRDWFFAAALRRQLLSAVLVPALLLGAGGSAWAAVINSTWVDGDGNWNIAANWNPAQVPDNGTDQFIVSINNGATVTLDRLVTTVNALFIDLLASPASRLFINGNNNLLNEADLLIASGGSLFNGNVLGTNAPGTGVVVLGGGTNINAGTFLGSGGGTFEVNGAGHTLDNSFGVIRALDGSRAVISGFGTTVSGGTFSTAGTGVVAMGGPLVNLSGVTNTGTFAIPGNLSPAAVLGITGASTNTGTMGVFEPGKGTILLGSTLHNTGTLLGSGGGTLEVNGAGHTLDNSSGTIRALDGSRAVISGSGTTVSGGTLSTVGTGVVGMSGFLVNLSGVTNTGTFAIPGNSSPASALDITGPSTNTGTMGLFEPGKAVIVPISTLTNTGTLQASGGGNLQFNGGTINNSSGVITALNSSLVTLFNSTTVSGGTIATAGTGVVEVFSGSIANVNGVTNTGTFSVPDKATLEMTGNNTNTGTMGTFAPGVGVIALNGHTLTSAGTLQASGGGTFEVNMGGSGTLNNTGTVQAIGGSTFEAFNGGTVTNSGKFFVDAGSQLIFSGVPSITTSGTVSIASGGTLDTKGSTYVQTAGVTNVNGTLSAPVDIRGGTLSGTGLVIGDVRNGGTVAPGNSPGILTLTGNYTQTSGGVLDIEIGGLTVGTGYDRLRVFGNALLAGTLDVDLINSFTPTTDAFFDVLLTGFLAPGVVTGTFATVDLPTSSGGLWKIEYLSDRVRIDFAVPQASSFLLTIAGLGVLVLIPHLGRRVFSFCRPTPSPR